MTKLTPRDLLSIEQRYMSVAIYGRRGSRKECTVKCIHRLHGEALIASAYAVCNKARTVLILKEGGIYANRDKFFLDLILK